MDTETASRIIVGVHRTEKVVNMMTKENKIAFIVSEGANKAQIKEAVEYLFGVKVESVNTLITPQGKKAYVKLKPEFKAIDLANKLGVM